MKSAIYITVRTSSSRLPGKTLKEIAGKKVIEHIIDRAKMVKNIDHIIVCTSNDPSDDILEQIAKEQGVLFYRGSLKDKLDRWLGAARYFNIDYFVEYDADDFFCGPELMELASKQMTENPCDYLDIPRGSVCGGAATCISVPALERICKIKATNDTEMYHPYFIGSGLCAWREVNIDDRVYFNSNIRLTLDYKEDLEFFRQVFKEMKMNDNTVSLRDILGFLEKRPDLVKINWSRHADYLVNQKKLTPMILNK